MKGEKGQKIVLRHAEVLDKDGNFYPETLRQAKSIDTFICNGEEQIFDRILHSTDSVISVWKEWKNLQQISLLPV